MIDTPDTQIQHQVEELLGKDRRTKDAAIDVACHAGLVTLSGAVPTVAAKVAAEEIARSVAGVVAVDNELRVR